MVTRCKEKQTKIEHKIENECSTFLHSFSRLSNKRTKNMSFSYDSDDFSEEALIAKGYICGSNSQVKDVDNASGKGRKPKTIASGSLGTTEPPMVKKRKTFAGPSSNELQIWLEEQKVEHQKIATAFQHCYSGMKLYEEMPEPKPLPFNSFMLKYLGTAPIDSRCFELATRMLHKDFKNYYYEDKNEE